MKKRDFLKTSLVAATTAFLPKTIMAMGKTKDLKSKSIFLVFQCLSRSFIYFFGKLGGKNYGVVCRVTVGFFMFGAVAEQQQKQQARVDFIQHCYGVDTEKFRYCLAPTMPFNSVKGSSRRVFRVKVFICRIFSL